MRAAPSAVASVTVMARALRTSVQRSSTPALLLTPFRAHPWDPDATLLLWWAEILYPTAWGNLASLYLLQPRPLVEAFSGLHSVIYFVLCLKCKSFVLTRPQGNSTDLTSVIKMKLKRNHICHSAVTLYYGSSVCFVQKITSKLPVVPLSLKAPSAIKNAFCLLFLLLDVWPSLRTMMCRVWCQRLFSGSSAEGGKFALRFNTCNLLVENHWG